jgi:hypothetical protein
LTRTPPAGRSAAQRASLRKCRRGCCDIREARREIARIVATLGGWGVVELLPDDVDLAAASVRPRRLQVFIGIHDVALDAPLAVELAAPA